jgi:hypothetical protein
MKPRQEDIPRSILKYTTVNVDAGFHKLGCKILFLSTTCVVVGIGDLPYVLYTTPEFTIELLPPNVAEIIYEVKSIVLQSTFTSEPKLKKNFPLPQWLSDFKKVKHLKLADATLDNLSNLLDLPIQHLLICDTRFSDADNLVGAIQQFKHLKYLVYDQSFPSNVVEAVQQLNLGVTLLTEEGYNEKRLFEEE